jgi:lipoprotein-anchoring transpeptidase ErfK/SrfK
VQSRSFVLVVVTMVVLFTFAGGLLAYDSSRRNVIASGIKLGGIDIGGLTVAQARARVRSAYRRRAQQPLVARFGGRRFVLVPASAHVAVDVDGGVAAALAQTRSADIFTRTWRSLTGGRIDAELDPQVSFSQAAVAAFVSRIARKLDRPARDASVSYAGGSLDAVPSRIGLSVDATETSSAIDNALRSPAAGREIRIATRSTEPSITARGLAARYPTIITVDRSAFRLRLYKHLRLSRSYPIAVGMAGLETPAGLYHVQDKEVDPSWHVPNSAWAGALAGQTVPPGPQDPIKARWMGIFNGAGIHGTDVLGSLGTAASHGCIRMAIPDVIMLYDQTPLGTPVYIV